MEIDQNNALESSSRGLPPTDEPKITAEEVRSMETSIIERKLISDISAMAFMPSDTIDKDAPLGTIMDSLSISQFKGLLEQQYFTKLSDDYLFREKTSINKLVEVVKLGYAPDDGEAGAEENGSGTEGNAPATYSNSGNGGLAGCLGCPPGVYCTIM